LEEDAIARFGVGKNMVASMRHWAIMTGMIEEAQKSAEICPTPLGESIFGKDGLDPYMEHFATLWLIHWRLATNPPKNTWFWVFNHYTALTFERDQLVNGLLQLAKDQGWTRVSPATIKTDVACFIRTYVSGAGAHEDALESPLTELGIVRATGKRDGFRMVRGLKTSLGNGVFVYALLDFWQHYSPESSTLSFEAIAHGPGSPGRAFLLDENEVVERLTALDDITHGQLRWSETSGLKQVIRDPGLDFTKRLSYMALDYAQIADKEIA